MSRFQSSIPQAVVHAARLQRRSHRHGRHLYTSASIFSSSRHNPLKLGIGALATSGALIALYHTTSKRQTLTHNPHHLVTDPQGRRGLGTIDGKAGETKRPSEIPAVDARGSQWQIFSDKLAATKDSVSTSLSTLSVGSILPDWSIGLPDWISRLQKELNMKPGSLAHEIMEEARDSDVNPELNWEASVRISPELCAEEEEFLRKRRRFTQRALALYLDIPEEDIHEDDVPIIATTGSGGGLRSLVASTGYYQAMDRAGLFDCVTYTAGVSGTCWLQSLYMSSIGQQSFERIAEHIKSRIGVHLAYPPKILELLDVEPTNKYLLSGLVEKLKLGASSLNLVDLYGVLLGARLLVPADDKSVDPKDLKLSNQSAHLKSGQQPMPIYTAVRHEIPFAADDAGKGSSNINDNKHEAIESEQQKKASWFQWFEITPYEVYCEDLEAGIPTWSLGRKFENGVNVDTRVPELKLPLLMGIFGSAFCATLSHYYQEIRPFVTSLSFLNRLDEMVLEVRERLTKVHAFDPATVPNYVKGLSGSLPNSCPPSLYEAETIQLMDAGMSNNLACYPLMRKGRNVDVVIAFDSSADIQSANWISHTSGYAKQRKIQGWPVSLGWPPKNKEEAVRDLEGAQVETAEQAEKRLNEAKATELGHPPRQEVAKSRSALGALTVWVGSKESREVDEELPSSRGVQEEWQLMRPDAGIVVAYLPLISNPRVPGVDPDVSPYLSTWNFEWTPEQVDKTLALARANFDDGAEKLRDTILAVYNRKKRQRLERERLHRSSLAKSLRRAIGNRLNRTQDQFS